MNEILKLLNSNNFEDIILGLTILAQTHSRKECELLFGYYYDSDNYEYVDKEKLNYFKINTSMIKPIALVFPHVQFYVGNYLLTVINEEYIKKYKMEIYE